MRAISWNTGWTYRHLDGSTPAVPVTLPHDAALAEPRTETAAGGTNTGWYEGYDYLYERRFTPDAAWQGQTLLLEFEGVYHNAEVSLNGETLTFRPYGYTNYVVDLTDRLLFGQENRLAVIARNADQPNSRWYSGAGIYRPVVLWVGGKDHIQWQGLRVHTVGIDPPEVEVQIRMSGAGAVEVEVLDGDAVAARTTLQAGSDGVAVGRVLLAGARLWSPADPYLYTVRARYAEDVAETTMGIRSLTWGDEGFLINGERFIIQGACIHHDNGLLGAVCHPDAVRRKVRLLKENGYNAIRSAHNPCSKALLAECDAQGVLVMDEYIDHWYIHKTEHDYVDYFYDWWRQDLTDMVDKDYNHPCVVLYSTGNEVSETAQEKGIALTREMTEFLHGLDATRPVTCGVNIFFNFLSSIGFGVYSDDKAKKQADQAKGKKKAVGSQFFNNLAGLMGSEFMKRGATLHMCDVKTRDAFAAMDIAGYNYGIYRYGHDLKRYPHRLILGSETFCNDAYRFREQAKREPRLVGDFVWAGMDYLGEVMVGSWEYADYAPRFDGGLGWVSAGSGRIDLTGKPLGEALYTRVALEEAQGPFLAVRPVNHSGDRHSPSAWKMTNAMESWTWPGCEGRKAEIEVYARAASVALFLNGQEIGRQSMRNDCLFRFHCTYQPGVLAAIAYDGSGKEIGRCALQTAGENTELRAEPEEQSVQAGHLAYVRLRYTDDMGILKPMTRDAIKVSVQGGRLLALGNACPFNLRGYLTDETEPYWGEALAIVEVDAAGGETAAGDAADNALCDSRCDAGGVGANAVRGTVSDAGGDGRCGTVRNATCDVWAAGPAKVVTITATGGGHETVVEIPVR